MVDAPLTIAEIVIEEFTDMGEEPYGAFARGHHAPEAFLETVRKYLIEEWGELAAIDALDGIEPRHVSRVYWRDEPDANGVLYLTCDKSGKGAYPVTRVDWAS